MYQQKNDLVVLDYDGAVQALAKKLDLTFDNSTGSEAAQGIFDKLPNVDLLRVKDSVYNQTEYILKNPADALRTRGFQYKVSLKKLSSSGKVDRWRATVVKYNYDGMTDPYVTRTFVLRIEEDSIMMSRCQKYN